jgi:fibronectin type 3 domain-containing protein
MNKHIKILFVLLGIFALAGCKSPLDNTEAPVSGAVVVSIQTPETAGAADIARTIYPALTGFTRYELSFSEGPMAHAPVAISVGVNSPIELVVGAWTITVTAYKGETPSARGSATVTVSAGETTPVSIILGPISGGSNGTLSYSVASPSGASGSLTIQTISGGAVSGGTVALAAGTTSANTLSLPPGEYRLFVSLTKAGNHAGQADVLHIYSGLTSVASYTFTGDDFVGVETLNPEYVAFIGAAGATALPSNAAAITAAKGGNTAVFAIASGTGAAISNASTGELTMGNGGTITVSLTITTAGGVVTHMGTSANITVTKTVVGAAITGLTGVLQIGETTTATATTAESGTKVWASSVPAVATIDSSTGAVAALTAGSTTISYTVTAGNVVTSNSAVITVYAAAQTLAPTYAAFTGAAGATALPNNATAINTTKGDNTAVFAITSGTGAATINASDASTGKLTMGSGGEITVSLRIATAAGVITHKGTSATVTVTLISDPTTPSGVTASAVSSSSITISWTAVSWAANYRVFRSSSSSGTYTQVGIPTAASYTDGNLSANTAYYYKVSAVNEAGESEQSGYVSATTRPDIPTNVTATAVSSSSITVGWTAVTGATSYKVYRFSPSYSLVGSPTSNTYIDTGLSGGITYNYYVSAVNASGEGQTAHVSTTTPTVDLYVGTSTTPESGISSLTGAITWLGANAVNNGVYTIELKAAQTINQTTLSYSGKTVKITLKGDTTEQTVSLMNMGSLFTIGSGVTLTLDDKVKLQGRGSNASLVVVGNSGTLAMKGNAKITGNTADSGGGVYVSGGSFTMSGNATVTGNTASPSSPILLPSSYPYSSGGGVYVSSGSFTMSDNATVTGNTASYPYSSYSFSGSGPGSNIPSSSGGGVYVNSGSFIMNDSASVSNNTVSSPSFGSYGGGVYIKYGGGSFTMNNSASVSSNTASSSGGGVYVSGGGDVYGSFTMNNSASVTGNTASSGGGVYAYGNFTMNGTATVTSNTASSAGGGVYVPDFYSNFNKIGGVIYGSNAGNSSNKVINTSGVSQTNRGAAVYVYNDDTHRRENTVSTALSALWNDGSWTYTYNGQWSD